MLRNFDQKAADLPGYNLKENEFQIVADSEMKNSSSVDTAAAAISRGEEDAHNQNILANNNKKSTLEEPQTSREEDKLSLQAIQELKQPKMFPAIEVLPSSPDTCAEATHTPKVALLFLTRGNLFHEPIWKEWFQSAAGVLPAENAALAQNVIAETNLCGGNTSDSTINSIRDTDIIKSQHLFNVYIHAPPTFNGKL